MVRKLNTIKPVSLHPERFCKYTPDTLSEWNCTNEKFQTDDDTVISHHTLYSITWEAERIPQNLSISNYIVIFWRWKTQTTIPAPQQKRPGTFTQRHNNASDSIIDEQHSDRRSCQDHVDAPKKTYMYLQTLPPAIVISFFNVMIKILCMIQDELYLHRWEILLIKKVPLFVKKNFHAGVNTT